MHYNRKRNNQKLMRSLALLLAFFAFSLAQAPVVLGAQKSDDQIYNEVRQKLANNAIVKGGAIDVDVKNGAVTLRGKVAREEQKTKAAKVAKKVKGVTSVANDLVVENPNLH